MNTRVMGSELETVATALIAALQTLSAAQWRKLRAAWVRELKASPKLVRDLSRAIEARRAWEQSKAFGNLDCACVKGHYTSEEFAARIGRHRQWVTDRCSARVIKTLPGGKQYRIPLSELEKWNEL